MQKFELNGKTYYEFVGPHGFFTVKFDNLEGICPSGLEECVIAADGKKYRVYHSYFEVVALIFNTSPLRFIDLKE